MSVMLASIEDELEQKGLSHVVDSVGDFPTSCVLAMESSDANKWNEKCDSEFKSLK